jgi:membrane-bound serine protease (ClpP class)
MKRFVIGLFCLCLALSLVSFLETQEKPKEEKEIVYVISLRGAIDTSLARSIIKKLERVNTQKGKAVILEIDTPGGEVEQATKICREIERISQAGAPVYAYVTGHAWSAGALISLACDRIYMKEQASIGSAEVKLHSPIFGTQDAGEKWLSAMRADFRAYSERRNYPKALAEAMVDASLQVHEVHYRGERFFKTTEELMKMRTQFDADQIIDRGVIVPAGKLANFTAKEAKNYGFCKEIVPSQEALLKDANLASLKVEELTATAEDSVVWFLSNPWVRFFLIALGILGIVIELWTPGFGIPGILGVTCFALCFIGGYLADTAAVWEILLFIVGLALLAVEIFVLPGFGIVGVLGILCCFGALLLSFQTFILPNSQEQVNALMMNVFRITLSLGLDILALVVIARFLPESAPLRRLSIATVQKAEEGYSVAIPSFAKLVGQEGVASSQLRPAGRATINRESYDVVTQGDFIEVGQKIKVLEVQGNRIIVTKV